MGEKAVAREGDLIVCPEIDKTTKIPHICGQITSGSDISFLDGKPVAREGDKITCGGIHTHTIKTGVEFVLVNGIPVAVVGSDIKGSKGKIVTGSPTRFISVAKDTPGIADEDTDKQQIDVVQQAFNNIGKKNGKDALAEGLGELGQVEFMNMLQISYHKDFSVRYHGLDALAEITINGVTFLLGMEAKGNKVGSNNMGKNVEENKQTSEKANLKRAKQMIRKTDKAKKEENLEIEPTRQGGRYTLAEVALYKTIAEKEGNKTFISAVTHTETGATKVELRDGKGEVIGELCRFVIPDFEQKKADIDAKIKQHQNKRKTKAK